MNPDLSFLENIVDPDQTASDDQDPQFSTLIETIVHAYNWKVAG